MVKRGMEGGGLSNIGIGKQNLYEGMINSQMIGDVCFKCDTKSEPVLVTIYKGHALFVDFEPIINGEVVKIDFEYNSGSSCRLLNKLDVYEIIKNFYNEVLDNCLGKTGEEQNDYLFRYNEAGSRPNYPNLPELTKKSEDYIRSLSDNPSDKEIKDLTTQVISKDLEFGFYAKDVFGVEMNEYGKALNKKI